MKDQAVGNRQRDFSTRSATISWRFCGSVLLGIYVVLTLAGCTWIGLMRSDDQSFTGTDFLVLPASRADSLDIVAEVGKSMGFSVADREANIIRLSSSSSWYNTYVVGRLSYVTLRVSSVNEGTELNIDVYVSGNFDTGTQEAATKLMNDFKRGVLEAIARRDEKMQEKRAAEMQSAGGVKREPPGEQKPEGPKTETVPSTPPPLMQNEAQPVPPPLAVSSLEETAASTTATTVTPQGKAGSSPFIPGTKLVCIKPANVRAEASIKSKILRTLRKGAEVEYLGGSGDWLQVKLPSGTVGWIFNNLLKSK
jgi:hypothetical protein